MPLDQRDYAGAGVGWRDDQSTGWRGWSFTLWLVVICVVAFFVDGFSARASDGMGLLTRFGHFSFQTTVAEFQIWRWISFQFVHAGIWHIGFNLLILWFLGKRLESILGSPRFLAFYLISGVGGALLYLLLLLGGWAFGDVPFLLNDGPDTRLVGASAGIFGVLTALAVIAPDERIHLLLPPIAVPIRTLAIVLMLVQLYNVMVAGENAGGSAAHLGGVAMGYLLITNRNWLDFADRLDTGTFQRARQQIRKRRSDAQQQRTQRENEEVDRILDKVKASGLQSLTEAEKKTLRRRTEQQQKAG